MKRPIKFWVVPFFIAVFIFSLFRYVLFIGYVPSQSMEPEIKKGSYIVGLRITGELHTGDIVVFEKGEKNLVKRIAAAPGEVIEFSDDTNPPATKKTNKRGLDTKRIYTVPPDRYFMLGDNRKSSNDSRHWKEPFISQDKIIAKYLFGI